jgi:hypothetical protein
MENPGKPQKIFRFVPGYSGAPQNMDDNNNILDDIIMVCSIELLLLK